MGIKEYGQAAGEVELQDDPGPIKNQEGEAVIEITNDQEVGIGTSNPTEKLDVALTGANGGIRVKNATDNAYVKIDAPADEAAYIDFQTADSTDWQLTRAPNSNDLAVYDNDGGAGYMVTFEQGGNVGIGTTNPAAKLDVAGSIVSTGDLTLGDDKTLKSASGGTVLTIDASANITFSNNVSISTGSTINMPATVTLPNTANGTLTTSAVAVDANGKDLTVEAGSTTGGSGTNNTGTGGDLTFKPGAGKGTAVGGDVIIQTAPAGASGTTVNNYTTQMIVKESGNVGMGTTGPDRKLDILDASNPQLRLTHTDATHYADMQVAGTGALTVANSGGAIRLDSAGDVELDSASTNATMKLLAAGTEKASIDSTSDDVSLTVATADKDFKIKGTDDSAAITAFTIDFSEAGRAIFNNNIRVGGNVIEASDGGATITMDDSDNVTIAGDVQVSGNDIKDSGGNTALTFDGSGNISNDVVVTGSLAYKPKVIETSSANTDLTTAQSGATVLLSGSGTARLPAITTSASVGIQYVIVNTTTSTISGAIVRDAGNTANFFDADTTSGETASQDVEAMKAKTCICFAANKWLVVG